MSRDMGRDIGRERDVARPTGRRAPLPLIIAMVALAFVGGAILTGWLITRYDLLQPSGAAAVPQRAAAVPKSADPAVSPAERAAPDSAPAALAAAAQNQAAMAAATTLRVAELETALARIGRDATAAAAEAGRAEALLALASARRALDAGLPLGGAGDALARRFAAEAPAEVRRIEAAARAPVTREDLTAGLAELRTRLLRGEGVGGAWQSLRRGLSELFVLRRAGSPPTATEARLDRAARLVAGGNVAAAIAEVEKLPGAAAASGWLDAARRYTGARAALDRLETRVFAEPRAPAVPAPVPALPQPQPQQPFSAPGPAPAP